MPTVSPSISSFLLLDNSDVPKANMRTWGLSIEAMLAASREALVSAGRTYYVRADGSDANNGLTNTAGGAFRNIQKAVDSVASLDLFGRTASIIVGDGTYPPFVLRRLIGGNCNIVGNITTPTNCIIDSPAGASNVYGEDCSGWFIDGVYFTGGNAYHVQLTNGASLDLGRVNFGATSNGRAHKLLQNNSRLRHLNVYTTSGGAGAHEQLDTGARLQNFGFVHFMVGTPAWGTAFLVADTTATANYGGASWSGAATGKRYDIQGNAAAKSFGVTLPGSVAGTTATGGEFI